MIGLEVYLNRKKLTVAGADDLGVLNAIVAGLGNLGKATRRFNDRRATLFLTVGGLTRRMHGADEHLNWLQQLPLRVGDTVRVRIVRTQRPQAATSSTTAAEVRKQAARFKLKSSRSRHRSSGVGA